MKEDKEKHFYLKSISSLMYLYPLHNFTVYSSPIHICLSHSHLTPSSFFPVPDAESSLTLIILFLCQLSLYALPSFLSFCLNFQLSLLSHTITMTIDSLSFPRILENSAMCLYQV